MKSRNMVEETYVCPDCGGEMYVPRKHSAKRSKNHIKDLWCVTCGKITKHKQKDYYA